jgi:hypothetical protein
MTVRRRVRVSRSGATRVGIVVCGLVALGVAWFAGCAVALALGADPDVIDRLTGYRDVVTWLAALQPPVGAAQAIVIAGGLAAFLLLGWLALAQLPRPRLPRGTLVLEHAPLGTTTVEPRAIERAAEGALAEAGGFEAVAARWEDGTLVVSVTGSSPRRLASALQGAGPAVAGALERHGLPAAEVRVLLRRVRPGSIREVA